jgi:hypothetical protein
MKQHLNGKQLKELEYEDRITLLSLATGLTKAYMDDEYRHGLSHEDDMLLKYGYDVKIGELIEIVEDYTGQFPVPTVEKGQYRVKLSGKSLLGINIEVDSDFQSTYCDALFEIIKVLLKNKYIVVE